MGPIASPRFAQRRSRTARSGEPPTTSRLYHGFSRTRRLTHTDLDRAVDDLFNWKVHERAGLHIASDASRVSNGTVAEFRIGTHLLGVNAPVRVVYVIDEPDRRGFAYGTLPGHPESGEESFVLARNGVHIDFTIAAFSRPATLLARIGGPVTRAVQRRVTSRYLAAPDVSARAK